MKNESVKKSLDKSKNVRDEKRKMVKRKMCIKETNTFKTINFVQAQLTRISATTFVWEQFKTNRQMSEEMLLNDRLCNLIQGL